MTDFNSLPEKIQKNLARLSGAVAGVIPVQQREWKIHTGALDEEGDDPEVIDQVKVWAGGKGAYLYTLIRTSNEPNNDVISRAFADAKAEERGTRAYARLNQPSSSVYVGSSEKIHQRLKEHLGFGAKGTYSLQLAAWARPYNFELAFWCAQYPSDTPSDVLQALEDTLWAEMRPMFGRQGAR